MDSDDKVEINQVEINHALGRMLGLLLFGLGIVIAAALSVGIAWADFEASMFDMPPPMDGPYEALHCPLMISRGESRSVTAQFDNPSTRAVRRLIRVHVSDGFVSLVREIRGTLELAAGESQTFAWEVSPADAAWDRFVLVRVNVLRSNPLPSMTATCGIWVLPLPWPSGRILAPIAITLGFVLTVAGLGLWLRSGHSQAGRRPLSAALATLAILTLGALAATLLSGWLWGGLLLILTVIVLLVIGAWTLEGN